MVRGQLSGLGMLGVGASLPQHLVPYSPFRRCTYPPLSAATTLEKTLAIWLPMVKRITTTRRETRTRTPAKATTVIPTAAPTPAREAWAAHRRPDSQVWPLPRQSRSSDCAGQH